jgi:putative molybdopterin biosynthesis protein
MLRFVGSHDMTVELMARRLAEEVPEAELSVEYTGSLGGLMALARHEADIAGTHLWDETTDSYNTPFIRRLLPGCRVALVTLAHRSLGLITPPGNPQVLARLADLAQPGVRLVNRQAGSGTRVWLDAQLKALNISPERLPGYEREELTHLAVASAVEQGEATVGLGIHAAAAAYGLDFIPLTQERYDLVFLETVWHLPSAQALVRVIRSAHFKEAIAALGGYDTRQTGQESWIT